MIVVRAHDLAGNVRGEVFRECLELAFGDCAIGRSLMGICGRV